jgi:BclB C-terminal domain-containing protein
MPHAPGPIHWQPLICARAYASNVNALSLIGTTVTLQAQLWKSTTADNTLTPVAGATVTLAPALTGIVALGAISSGTTAGLSIPVTNQTRLMVVYTASAAGLSLIDTVTADVTSGVGIS